MGDGRLERGERMEGERERGERGGRGEGGGREREGRERRILGFVVRATGYNLFSFDIKTTIINYRDMQE